VICGSCIEELRAEHRRDESKFGINLLSFRLKRDLVECLSTQSRPVVPPQKLRDTGGSETGQSLRMV
jgi:hypothetical protein